MKRFGIFSFTALVLVLCLYAGCFQEGGNLNSRFGTLDVEKVTATATEINTLDGVTATYTELNYTDVTAAGTAQASKAAILGTGRDLDYFGITAAGTLNIAATAIIDLDGGFTSPVAITSAYDSLTAAESGRTIIGRPLAAKTSFILPPAAAGLSYTFYIVDADSGRVRCATGDSLIAADGSASLVSGTIAGTATFAAADTIRWFMINPTGTWTASAN